MVQPVNAADATLHLSTVAVIVVVVATWVGGIAGVYYSLKGQIMAHASRMDSLSTRLTDGAAKFAQIEATHKDHGDRLVRLETRLTGMDDKLDILVAAAHKGKP